MQLHQGYLLSVGERYFLVRGQLKATAMGAYALGILSLIKFLLQFIKLNEINAKEVIFADNFSVAGNLNSIKDYWDKLTAIGQKYRYFPKPTKSYLIVKEKTLMEAQTLFANSWMNIISERKNTLRYSYRKYRTSCLICERFSQKLGQPTYNFVNYCRSTTASSLFSICQWV